MKKTMLCFIVMVLLVSGCRLKQPEKEGTQIKLSDKKITVDGQEITTDSKQAVYSAKDIVFYLAGQDFTYGEGEKQDEHEQKEADDHTVIHITKPGKYVLSGELSLGQIAVDLGEEAKEDPEAVVTLVLDNVDITCTVAPAIIFYNVYECCSSDIETAAKDVNTKKAGANVIIADGTENNVNGSYVAKIYKSYKLSEDGKEIADSKKLHKYDGAFYSKQTLNIDGEKKEDGILNIKAENEGLDSELHLTINGGIINIVAGNDGINTNEDNVSVTTVNGGTLNILCDGSTGEGDGIDSNGWLVINGGTINAQACSTSGDAGIDSDKGIYINGGNVVATGNMLDHISGGEQTYIVFNFSNRQNGGTYSIKNAKEKVVDQYALTNDFTYLIVAGDELVPGDYTFWIGDVPLTAIKTNNIQGGMMPQGGRPDMPQGENGVPEQGMPPGFPEGMERPEMPRGERPEMPKGEKLDIPEGMELPERDKGMMGGNMVVDGERSAVFAIEKGGNYFVDVRSMIN